MTTTQQPSIVLDGRQAYRLEDIQRFFGSAVALREARKDGLKVRYVGKRGYVLGIDVLAYLSKAPTSRNF